MKTLFALLIVAVLLTSVILISRLPASTNKSDTPVDPLGSQSFKPEINENVYAVKADLKFSYLYENSDKSAVIYRQVDFATSNFLESSLPYVENWEPNEIYGSAYVFSPDGKYVARLSQKKIEMALIEEGAVDDFRVVFESPKKLAQSFLEENKQMDYSSIGDAMWDDKGVFYFTNQVGVDGGPSPFGNYTHIYRAQEDGRNPQMIYGNELGHESIWLHKQFAYINSNAQTLYFTGITHGGHTTPLVEVSIPRGTMRSLAQELGYFIPTFSSDFSYAFFTTDTEEKGYDDVPHTKLYSYNLKTGNRILLREVAESNPNFYGINSFRSGLFVTKNADTVYFNIDRDGYTEIYGKGVGSDEPERLLLAAKCSSEGLSNSGKYLLLKCFENNLYSYEFFHIQSGDRFVFHEGSPDNQLRVVRFN